MHLIESKKTVLVTGASGFIGNALCRELLAQGFRLVMVARSLKHNDFENSNATILNIDLCKNDHDWSGHLESVDTVIHLAARAHVIKEQEKNSLSLYRQMNVESTELLVKSAASAGVRRFIYLSSVKVNGEENNEPYSELDKVSPLDEYGLSKSEAEDKLIVIAGQSKMEFVIIRPPLVYGPGVKANFFSLIKLVDKAVLLPFANIDNKRSLIALENLVNFILCCIDHPKASNEIFLISDVNDISTTELVNKIANTLNKKILLFSVPPRLTQLIATLLGKKTVARRLLGSLSVDSSKARTLLGWKPVITFEEQLKKTVDAYLYEKIV